MYKQRSQLWQLKTSHDVSVLDLEGCYLAMRSEFARLNPNNKQAVEALQHDQMDTIQRSSPSAMVAMAVSTTAWPIKRSWPINGCVVA